MPAVEVDGLEIRYGDLVAVNGVSFAASAGAVTALLGPNGAGKTSTIEASVGLRRPSRGQVRILGLDPVADHAALVRRVGVMLQGGGVYPGIRVGEAVRLFCAYHDAGSTPDELIERVGLTERRTSTWRQLSGGEQQRLSLALALAGDPEVVILDEPTAGVDVHGRHRVRAIVRELAEAGRCVVLCTHELDEAERLADHVVIVDRGVVVASGTPAELRGTGGDELRFSLTGGARLDTSLLAAALGAAVDEVARGEYRVAAAPEPALVARLTGWLAEHGHALGDLRGGRQRLEDVFVRLTAERGTPADTPAPAPGGRARRRRR